MHPDDLQMLLRLLAALETLFWPYRWVASRRVDRAAVAVFEKRSAYASEGLPWRIGGEGRDRQAGFKTLKRLQTAGLIRLHPGKRAQRAGVSLRMVDRCLSVAPINVTSESWPLLEHVAKLESDPGVLSNSSFVVEHDVVGMARDSTDGLAVVKFTDKAMPLLIAGLLETMSDTTGLIGWRVTPAGRLALASGPPDTGELLEYDASLADEYLARVEVGLAERNEWIPERRTLVHVPLSAGLWMTTAQWKARRERIAQSLEAAVDD